MRLNLIALALALVACHRPSPSTGDADSGSRASSAESSASSASPAPALSATDAIDAPKTKKHVESLAITYLNGSRIGTSAFLGFVIDNEGAEEQPISSMLSIQATTKEGLTGELNHQRSKCDGIAPPHGRFACIVEYKFQYAPTELRVRVEGAWFHIEVKDDDAGAKR